jgi:hypothetical protein
MPLRDINRLSEMKFTRTLNFYNEIWVFSMFLNVSYFRWSEKYKFFAIF